ncbi:CYFA0S04e03972g1_1 [Cyberlindnera fabianii]|uniref:TBP-associated factor 6 n=1 Tax=Cyberlindnera fabianii TaxID=36022 RepID=A0A061AZE4_CYBFA|nr:CYFA0S04e03972g1_1 [Cyberlindnera fabianii]
MAPPNQAVKAPLSHTLWSPIDTVKDVADSLGLTDLNDEASRNLAMDVEYRIHEILEQAVKFMRHSKRRTLTTTDIEKALKVLNVEPLYGYDVARPLNFKEALVGNGQTLYYIDNEEVDFEKLVNQPLPKVPRSATFTAHWLAIEGVQPAIPQNPLESEIRQMLPAQRGAISHILTENSTSTSSNANTATGTTNALTKDTEVKPQVKHVLSKELQVYFNKVVQALTNQDDTEEAYHLRQAALSSLRSDPGLHQLVPYFIQFISEQITHNLNNIALLSTMLEVVYSLLSNDNIFLDPYIHVLMPCILTLLLAKRIGSGDDHIAVRDFASSLLEHVCKNYGKSYTTLRPRVTRTLLKAFLDTGKPVGTLYGAIIGLRSLGAEVVRITILGNLQNWTSTVLNPLKAEDKELLTTTIIKTLKTLIDDNSGGAMDVEVSEAEVEKLKKRVGDHIAEAILADEDSKKIVDAIFFGDLSA